MEELKRVIKKIRFIDIKFGFDGKASTRPDTIFEFSKGFAAFFHPEIYFRIKGSISREIAAKVYEKLSMSNFFTLDEDIRFKSWSGGSEHDLDLQTAGKVKSSACSREEIHHSLYVFFDVNNKIFIVSIEELPNKYLESLQFYVETCEIKDYTCGSEANVDDDGICPPSHQPDKCGTRPFLRWVRA